MLTATFAVRALPSGFDDPPIRAFRAKADAFVSETSRQQNFGRARVLRMDASPRVRSYIRFRVNYRSEEILHATLLLYSRTRSALGYRIVPVASNWNEDEITYANAPRLAPRFVASGPLRARGWKAVDVTSLVTQEHRVSFALTTASPNGIEVASRETGLHGPRLVVERTLPETTTGS